MTKLIGYTRSHWEYDVGNKIGHTCVYYTSVTAIDHFADYIYDVTVKCTDIVCWKSTYVAVGHSSVAGKMLQRSHEYLDHIMYLMGYQTYDTVTNDPFVRRIISGELTRSEFDELVKFQRRKRISCKKILMVHSDKF